MSDVRVTFFTSGGVAIADLYGVVTSVTWRLSAPGDARIEIPSRNFGDFPYSAAATGGRVLIQFEDLPAWVGIIEPDREQDDKKLTLHAKSVEYLLRYRYTGPLIDYHGGASAGEIFRALINCANSSAPTGMTIGDVYTGGNAYQRTYHYANILDSIIDIVSKSTQGYTVTGSESKGRLSVRLDWLRRVGSDKSGTVVLQEGSNISPRSTRWKGGGIGAVTVVGKGHTWANRPVGYVHDDETLQAYGYRMFAMVDGEEDDSNALTDEAAEMLSNLRNPQWRLQAEATDVGPAGFSDYSVGDIVRVIAYSGLPWEFDGKGRIWTREWTPDGVVLEVGNE